MGRFLQAPVVNLPIYLLLCTVSTSVTPLSQGSRPDLALPINVVYQFPEPAWFENFAVRWNGDILVTLLATPDLYLISPSTSDPSATLVFTFPFAASLLGISELGHDVFYVAAGNASIAGSFAIWEVDMRSVPRPEEGAARVRKVTDIPEALLLNGVVVLSKVDSTVLIADSFLGVVWKLNVKTGAYDIAFSDSTTTPDFSYAGGLPGVNGLKIRDGYLYFTNTVQGLLCRVPISKSGTATGAVEILATELQPDDFDLDGEGRVWISQNLANVISVLLTNRTVADITSEGEDFTVVGPTSCLFPGEERFPAVKAKGDWGPVVKWDPLYCTTTVGQIVLVGHGRGEEPFL